MPQVLMYSTAVCPFCIRAEQLLRSKGVTEIEKIRVDLEPELRVAMMEKPDDVQCRKYINGEYVGGFEELAALHHAGELDGLLAKSGV